MIGLKNKKILASCIIFLVLIISFIIFLLINGQNKYRVITIEQAINFNNLDKVKKSNKKIAIANKYEGINKELIGTNYVVKIGKRDAQLLLLRDNKLDSNIIQGKYLIKQDGDLLPLSQIGNYIDEFKDAFYYLVKDNQIKEEKLYGESKYKFSIPFEESIYVEKRLYSLSYDDDKNEEKYDMNFYMDGEYLVCEFIKFMK